MIRPSKRNEEYESDDLNTEDQLNSDNEVFEVDDIELNNNERASSIIDFLLAASEKSFKKQTRPLCYRGDSKRTKRRKKQIQREAAVGTPLLSQFFSISKGGENEEEDQNFDGFDAENNDKDELQREQDVNISINKDDENEDEFQDQSFDGFNAERNDEDGNITNEKNTACEHEKEIHETINFIETDQLNSDNEVFEVDDIELNNNERASSIIDFLLAASEKSFKKQTRPLCYRGDSKRGENEEEDQNFDGFDAENNDKDELQREQDVNISINKDDENEDEFQDQSFDGFNAERNDEDGNITNEKNTACEHEKEIHETINFIETVIQKEPLSNIQKV
ncbi:hypothetical protein Glove_562g7 [Diversispora epigaea]|uniref:Uncharacterized protein n=1 Tax=Diversispora epigaea TaxID=1348612 RepID=A0A397GDX3_9GLOM|nr:hypothetical protein Glove_562g7 [Diversispora epigaea]